MSKTSPREPEIAEEYDFSKGKRGVLYDRARRGVRVVLDAKAPARKELERSKELRSAGD